MLFIKNLPPESSVDLEVTEPRIYFGELSNDYVFVGTRAREFHYPRGDDNVFTSYDGPRRRARSGRSCASCCSRAASGRSRSCSART